MSFVLPGNARSLRFSGEISAAGKKGDTQQSEKPAALGRPRERRITTPAPPAPVSITPASAGPSSIPPPRSGADASGRHNRIAATPAPRISTPVPGSVGPHGRYSAQVNGALKTPYVGSISPPSMRPRMESTHAGEPEDNSPTTAMDREGLDVLPGGGMLRSTLPPPMPMLPPGGAAIPHFRPRTVGPVPTFNTNHHQHAGERFSMPLAIWLAASILVGVLSYHIAPQLFVRAPSPMQLNQ